jgi:hypothetical protein
MTPGFVLKLGVLFRWKSRLKQEKPCNYKVFLVFQFGEVLPTLPVAEQAPRRVTGEALVR